ncbi:MAG: BON domain-containing protein [Gemmatimonadota bacterium]|nr:BON domain-containing protein [Gemmatimonadota bacterium]MDE3129480.1 BON domain-containing protein [Gemmatimonadota bacterium]MDE3174408.1 BON domain-containing protein [Gemmatimonadota bacterium]MDE3216784.1 BON domain-containing protein [Gemmatimonadota bacterium]
MSVRFRRRDDASTTASRIGSALAGGLAGLAVGVVLAQLLGGRSGMAARLRRPTPAAGSDDAWDETGEEDDEDLDAFDGAAPEPADEALGRRVLEAFVNDPILARRAIDIDVHPDATVELSGAVDEKREVAYAETLARGVPGVKHVLTDLLVAE